MELNILDSTWHGFDTLIRPNTFYFFIWSFFMYLTDHHIQLHTTCESTICVVFYLRFQCLGMHVNKASKKAYLIFCCILYFVFWCWIPFVRIHHHIHPFRALNMHLPLLPSIAMKTKEHSETHQSHVVSLFMYYALLTPFTVSLFIVTTYLC